MASLPPRPVFTNLGTAPPTYNGRRHSHQPSDTNSRNSPTFRHYHPYARRSSTPAQGSPIPPWRRDRARQNRWSGPLGPSGHHHPRQIANPSAGRTGNACPPPTTNPNAGRPHQQTVYQSGPVVYGASMPPPQPPNTPRATGPAGHTFSSAASTARGGADLGRTTSNPAVANISHPTTTPFRPLNQNMEAPNPPRCSPPTPSATAPTPPASAKPHPPPPPPTNPPVAPVAVSVTATLGAATRTFPPFPARLLPNFTAWPQHPPRGAVVVNVVGVGAGAGVDAAAATPTAAALNTLPRPRPANNNPSVTDTTALLPTDEGDDGDGYSGNGYDGYNSYPLHIDLTPRAPLTAPLGKGECEAALDAVEVLMRVMVQHGLGVQGDVDVDVLWRLAGLKEALGLVPGWVAWLRGCMGRLVSSGLGRVPGGDGWDGGVLERALGVCGVFGLAEEARAVMKRAAYVWRVGDDGEGLVKPDGGRVDVAVCGKGAVDAILAAREQVLRHVFTAAQQSLYKWTVGIGNYPCRRITCNTHRIAALNTFLFWSGLYPRIQLTKSLGEIISALEYITSTDTELVAFAIEQGHADDYVCERLIWAAQIRNMYGGTCTRCTRCDKKTATSMLFPLEDLLCDLTFELEAHLVQGL